MLGVSAREMDRYVRDGMLHPIYAKKGAEPNYADSELKRLKHLRDGGNVSDLAPPRLSYSQTVNLLACPGCHGRLMESSCVACASCDETYPYSPLGALDLRPRRQIQYSVDFTITTPAHRDSSLSATSAESSQAEEWYKAHWPNTPKVPSVALELGCGEIPQKTTLEQSGFEYLGVDYDSTHAQMLVDAHALPFCDNSFPFVIAYAFLEHLQYPMVAMRETWRVLRPGRDVPRKGIVSRAVSHEQLLSPYASWVDQHSHCCGIPRHLGNAKVAPGPGSSPSLTWAFSREHQSGHKHA